MKVLVTGGAGFIGSHLVDSLVANNDVLVVDNLSTGSRSNVNSLARFYELDIRSTDLAILVKTEKPEVVYHLAAQASVPVSLLDPILDADINILGSLRLLESCIAAGTRKIIFSSTAAVYGTPVYLPVDEKHPLAPMSGYGLSKMTVEHYLAQFQANHRLEYTVLRYANVYGERQNTSGEGGVVSIFLDRLRQSKAPSIFGDGNQTRDFVYVKDVVNANLKATEAGNGQIINISTGQSSTVNDLFQTISGLLNISLQPIFAEPRAGDIRDSILDNRKAAQTLGWQPDYSLKSGLQSTLQNWV
ncbi:MAG: NAD-dependent epimerase/dehydratase family protein [Candidatus Saccharibacteria bacterium]